MVALGRTLLVSYFVFLLLAAIFVGASFAGFVNSGVCAIISAIVVIASCAGFGGGNDPGRGETCLPLDHWQRRVE